MRTPPLQNAIRPDHIGPCLFEHLLDGCARPFEVVRRITVFPGDLRIIILEIRQPALYLLSQKGHGMHALIAAAVINDRHRQRLAKTLEDRMGVMRRRHKIDIVRSFSNELEVDLPQPLDGDLDALSSFGDLIVLTVHAGQIAPGEKDRPRPARPCDARLLPVMKSRAGDHRQHPALAIAKLTLARDALPAHHLARTRTQIAYAHFD